LKELERSLGPVAVIAISMSSMLGSGIFVLPGLAAAKTGPSVWLAYVLAGLCVFPAAACKAELATAMPQSGGTYVYIDRIFGPLAGTVAGLGLWLSMLMKSAFALVGFGTYLAVLTHVPLKPTATVLLTGIIVLNTLGVQKVGRAQIGIVAVTLVGLVVLASFGLGDARPENLRHELEHGVGGLLAATGFVFVSYNGVTKVAAIAEEVKQPARNLPLGILLSLAIVMVLYALVALTLVAVVPHTELSRDLHPIYTLAHHIGGRWAGVAAAILGIVTMTSMANAGLLAASRFPFAMARDRLLPSLFAEVIRGFKTPLPAILLTGGAMLVALWTLDVERLAKMASGLVIILYVAETVAVVVFREMSVHWYDPKYRSPFYPWLHAFGILAGLALLVSLGATVLAGALAVALPGLALFVLYGRRRTERLGVVGQRTRRAALLKQGPSSTRHEYSVEGSAAVVVALFGKEHSPEVVVELGAALAKDEKLQVLHLTEVPEQALLDAALEEDVAITSLRRRVMALGEERKVDVDFHAVMSRDLGRTVLDTTARVGCEWVVMEWRGRERHTLLPYNPIGWLINNLDANLAFYKDAGIRFVREIVVFAEPGPHDALVVGTADHLARLWRARLTLVRYVADDAPMTELQAERDYLEQLRRLCKASVREEVVRGPDCIRAMGKMTAAYDLLVMGAPDVTLLRQMRGTTQDQIKARAACSVLTVRTPRQRTHEAFATSAAERSAVCRLPEFLAPGALAAELDITNKDVLFQHFAETFEDALGVPAREIHSALWDRERTQNTSVGHGVALPHATLNEAERACVGVFTTTKPVDYHGPDDQPVDVFFVTICPPSERETHLRLLSRIAALTLKTNLLERLREAGSADEMRTALEECTAEIDTN
jgi:APA family basic amino acid/polyamine antiporter